MYVNLYSHITSSEIKNLNVRFKASNITWWTVPKLIIDNASNLSREYLNMIGSKNNPPTEHEAKIQQWATHTETQHTRCCCFESDKQNLGGKKSFHGYYVHDKQTNSTVKVITIVTISNQLDLLFIISPTNCWNKGILSKLKRKFGYIWGGKGWWLKILQEDMVLTKFEKG